jgi:hypothetical protein
VTPVQSYTEVATVATKKNKSGDELLYVQVSDNDLGYVLVDLSNLYCVLFDSASFNVCDE